ncbi:hypothetical protein [Antarcticirhabdus aurantiaca]|uniref:Uncharacterized protein n=1 Tax=Antarcticirhabdus aurantiaca TaxID=2606717 RepID=A0ACD4NXJ1_9HYPH|nr:hypothetical protein [Antarcticirhabdus aurantiaca]WAJ31159.1 hypothetical protein OXU80_13550 [Jeongeuplla avenae]
MNILKAAEDPKLFGPWFKDRATWTAWRAFLAALFGEPMSEDEAATYRACTGRKVLPTVPTNEAWLVIGRRGGKSFVMALIAVYLACFKSYREFLAPGERATVLVIATDRRQARVILRYAKAMVDGIPMLKRMLESDPRADGFDLKNQVTVEVGTATFRGTRGYAFAAVLCDELAFWNTDDAAEPDFEILDAIRPGMSSIPTSVLLCASSPYARRGALWDAYKRFYGVDGAPLVWQASTRTMNPTIRQEVIDRAIDRDASSAAAEYGAQFRTDIEGFISREAVEACVATGVRERAPLSSQRYTAFVDPSGGSADSFTLAIGHMENAVAVLDALREVRPPFSPEGVVADYAKLLKAYGVTKVQGDRYAGEWPREQFRKHGIDYEPSARPKSDLYRDVLPALNSKKADLLDHDRLVAQFASLERRTSRGGRDSIDHPPNGHDDVANAVAGCLVGLVGQTAPTVAMFLSARHRSGSGDGR